ncbi:ATP synthase F1 subunit gamma [Cyclobacterium marinum]|uniref:ATP synthase gamma chain n=1 Tax=Cyclobacterium marinum (strain ATCC 25205 / DSM 745 / LMG 13164 / NCIMB 1802) TaxID=880070 RepID=G0IWY7_CYCMS|nr:ATP synthase F1 subunit gamma [Cyclobacterium marinum]AEL24905.1 ATP synthase gamma chain [Cyclobacterium marinum DSM 745]MBI0401620.1 ATP synthase F1 subunit gamma [Cyclobacterium marinum]
MANLKEVKERINSVSSTQQITKAMKMVAAAKLRRAQEKIVQMRPYSQKLTSILNNISSGAEGVSDIVYAQERSVANLLIVPITSDKGLCGAFNSNIIKAANVVIQEHQGQNITVMPVGKKALDFFKKQDYSLVTAHSGLFENITFEPVKKAAEYVMEAFVEGEFDQVILVYNQFKNVATQVVVKEQFLPIAKMEEEENDISQQDYIFEPSKDYIIEELVPNSLKIQFYKAILDSNASEHGARMTAMSKATDNAADLLKDLKLVYNRTRQAAITNEILEIVAGANALEGK